MTNKTRFLNIFRNIFRIPFLERFLCKQTQGKKYSNFFVKLLPANYQYPKNSIRKAFRNGSWFELDISDYMEYIIYFGIDAENRKPLTSIIQNNWQILDIGTNIGETILLFASMNKDGKNIGFEPVPYLFKKASTNLSLNNYKNIIVENIALSDKIETLYFNQPNNNNSGGIHMNKTNLKNGQQVEALTLDEYCNSKKIEHIDFIKIDVEGFELNVLKGGLQTIMKSKPIMFIEISENNLKSKNSSAKEIVELLTNLNYTLKNAYNYSVVNISDDFKDCYFDMICYNNN